MLLPPVKVGFQKVVRGVDVRAAVDEQSPGVQRVLADAVALLRRLTGAVVRRQPPQQCGPAVLQAKGP
jgi:hypothetical protein